MGFVYNCENCEHKFYPAWWRGKMEKPVCPNCASQLIDVESIEIEKHKEDLKKRFQLDNYRC